MKFFIFIWMLLAVATRAQDLPPQVEEVMEKEGEGQEQEQEKDDLLEILNDLKKHPLNINKADREDLARMNLLSGIQIDALLMYRKWLGDFIHPYELQAIPGWDPQTCRRVAPYIRIGDDSEWEVMGKALQRGDQTVLVRASRVMEKSRGYDPDLPGHYLGDALHILVRYRFQYKDRISFGWTAEKDAGEPLVLNHQLKGFDAWSFHLFLRRKGLIRSLALGDYRVNLGQGLIQWQSGYFGKTAEVMMIQRNQQVIAPYRGSAEYGFNRGGALTLGSKRFSLTLFVSYRKVSGNIDTADQVFHSLQTSGLHRTASELEDKNKIRYLNFGSSLGYETKVFRIGWNLSAHQFSLPFQKETVPYNLFSASGKRLLYQSLHLNYNFRNLHLFGEAAADKNFHRAVISGLLISLAPKMDLSFLFRDLSPRFGSLIGSAFSENTLPVNERGIYAGFSLRATAVWTLNAYVDLYQSPWLRYRVSAPSRGSEYFMQLQAEPHKRFSCYLRYRWKNKPLDPSTSFNIGYPVDAVKQNLRLHFNKLVSMNFEFRGRMEWVWVQSDKAKKKGFLSYLEASWKGKRKWSANFRWQYVESDDYDTRVYAYESDVMYSFSIPAFYEKGLRYYINVHYEITGKIAVWCRWSRSVTALSSMGSGMDTIEGNKRSEWKSQVIIHL